VSLCIVFLVQFLKVKYGTVNMKANNKTPAEEINSSTTTPDIEKK